MHPRLALRPPGEALLVGAGTQRAAAGARSRIPGAITLILLGLALALLGGGGVALSALVIHELGGEDAAVASWGVAVLAACALFGGLGLLCIEHGIRRCLKRGGAGRRNTPL